MESALNRLARTAYVVYPAGLSRIARRSTAPDFREKFNVALSEAPPLLPLSEGSEFVEGALSASKEAYSLGTFGRVITLSDRVLRNDDVGAFASMATTLANAAAEFAAVKLASLIVSNPVMSDGVALFHSSHANLATAAALSEASVGELLAKVYAQKGPNGQSIATAPKYLVVPAALAFAAHKLVATITTPGSAPLLEVVVEPRLDASSATAFYVASDPAVLPALEYSYLDGDEGPRIELRIRVQDQLGQVARQARLRRGRGRVPRHREEPGA